MTTQPKGVAPCECYPSPEEPWPSECDFCGALLLLGITRTEWEASRAALERVAELETELEHTENALGAAQLVAIKGMEVEEKLRIERDAERARADRAEANEAAMGKRAFHETDELKRALSTAEAEPTWERERANVLAYLRLRSDIPEAAIELLEDGYHAK